MASVFKLQSHRSAWKGVDRTLSSGQIPDEAFYDSRDIRWRMAEGEVFPMIVPLYTDATSAALCDTVDLSQENVETLCFLSATKAWNMPTASAGSFSAATIIKRANTFPTPDNANFNQCSIANVNTALGLGTNNLVRVVCDAGVPSPTFKVYDGSPGVLIGTFAYARRVTITIGGASFELGFVPNPTTDLFDNFVAATEWRFQHNSSFVATGTAPSWARWVSYPWGDTTYMVRYGQAYARQNGVYRPLFGSALTTEGFNQAYHVVVYERHLMVTNASGLSWSGLDDFQDMVPTFFNEADQFPILSRRSADAQTATMTGLALLGRFAYAYTKDTIYRVTYVGLPRVMQVEGTPSTVGSFYPYGVVAAGNRHYFISEENFYEFDGNQSVAIGDPIIKTFLEELTTDRVQQNLLWGYYDVRASTVVWHFPSKTGSGTIDRALYFDTKSRAWSIRSIPDVHDVVDLFYAQNLTAFQGDMTPGIGELAYQRPTHGLGRDLMHGETTTEWWNTQLVRLETGDRSYGEPGNLKDMDSFFFDSDYSGGVEVEVQVKNFEADSPLWLSAGNWSKSLPERRLSLPRESFRFARYRMTFQTHPTLGYVDRAKIYDYAENIRAGGAES